MKLRTEVRIEKRKHHLIDYKSKLFLIGSCFSDNIGAKFETFEFQSTTNPPGVIFNPVAIESFITRALNKEYFVKEDLFCQNGLYGSLEAHSKFNDVEEDVVLLELNRALTDTNKALEEASHVFLTLGTAWVYRHISTDRIVANCHKIPQKEFIKELLSVEVVRNALEAIVSLVSQINPEAIFIMTVSPVRHLKDGFAENNRSKAHLIAATHELVQEQKNCYYFPAYELVMDDLRDYRFFKEDMIHPSDQAVDYIWDHLLATWVDSDSQDIYRQLMALRKGEAHIPLNTTSEEYQQFKTKLERTRNDLRSRILKIRS